MPPSLAWHRLLHRHQVPRPTLLPNSEPTTRFLSPPSFSHLFPFFLLLIPSLQNSAPPSTIVTPEPGSLTILFWNTKYIAPTIKRFVIFDCRGNRLLTPQVTSLEPAGLRVLWQDEDGDRFGRAPPQSLELEVGNAFESGQDPMSLLAAELEVRRWHLQAAVWRLEAFSYDNQNEVCGWVGSPRTPSLLNANHQTIPTTVILTVAQI